MIISKGNLQFNLLFGSFLDSFEGIKEFLRFPFLLLKTSNKLPGKLTVTRVAHEPLLSIFLRRV